MSGEDRADRLRRRRQRTRDRAVTDESVEPEESEGTDEGDESDETAGTEAGEAANSDEAEKTDGTAKPGEAEKADGTTKPGEAEKTDESDEPQLSVKDEQKPTYMYLPHSVRRDLDRAYSIRKAEYEYEYEEPFEKNRHFYPLVVSLGLEAIDELDTEDVRSRLEGGL